MTPPLLGDDEIFEPFLHTDLRASRHQLQLTAAAILTARDSTVSPSSTTTGSATCPVTLTGMGIAKMPNVTQTTSALLHKKFRSPLGSLLMARPYA
mmetsp:Transcript_11677/g.40366  ORF Transcript_11677/g.40366 Transcript_11677/m.40366 type:complete len:96 (-) Transcript_11677:712-999(-)